MPLTPEQAARNTAAIRRLRHRFSNTQAQRERFYIKTASQTSRDMVAALSDQEFKFADAVANLDCYPEVAKELAQAIVKVLREENL